MPAALLDVDGTLVDTNYHHAMAWFRAFRTGGWSLDAGAAAVYESIEELRLNLDKTLLLKPSGAYH